MLSFTEKRLPEFFEQNKDLKIHNLSRGSIYTYFDLQTNLRNGNASLNESGNLMIGGRVKRVFSFSGAFPRALPGYRIYSAKPITGERIAKSIPFIETMYELEKVFDPKSYLNAKKRYQRLTWPNQMMRKHHIVFSQLTQSNLDLALLLHERWLDKKKADPKVFQIMLPGQRYARTTTLAVLPPTYNGIQFYGRLVTISGGPVAVRICSLEGDTAFDLANYGIFDEVFNGFAEVMNYLTLFELYSNFGIRFFNCGASGDRRLHAFKGHWPSQDWKSYAGSFGDPPQIAANQKSQPSGADETW